MSIYEQYLDLGYLIVEDFFSEDATNKILLESRQAFLPQLTRGNMAPESALDDVAFDDALFQLFENDYDRFVAAAGIAQHTTALWEAAANPEIVELLHKIKLVQPTVCSRPNVLFNSPRLAKHEGHWKTPPHQDFRSMQGSLNSVVVWFPLVDVTAELGALEVIPRSHMSGLLETVDHPWFAELKSEPKQEEFEVVEMKRGSVLVFSSFLIHRSGWNSTNQIRWSCQLRFNDAADPHYVENGYPNPYKTVPQKTMINTPSAEEVRKVFTP
ncbi:phytanoyl-CoA dioxygenase family protein [Bremerella sp. JC770]|uniref:phytanoyl-CoA dioxygenase family protein n=1 Tax=Bremerella sp. JC770 TaxID=3232137 RepID=UPI003458E47A